MLLLVAILSNPGPPGLLDRTHLIAQTVCAECQGCSRSEKRAIIQVIQNRLRYSGSHPGYWWGTTLKKILKYPQFAKSVARCKLRARDAKLSRYESRIQRNLLLTYWDSFLSLWRDVSPKMLNAYFFHAKYLGRKVWKNVELQGRRYWKHRFFKIR